MRSKALHILSILLLTVGIATTAKAQQIKILGNVYGGGDQAAVKGKTTVEINKGLYGGDIFGGGNGALYTAEDEAAEPTHKAGTVKSSADIGTQYDGTDGEHEAGTLVKGTGTTSVTINGGKFIVEQKTGDPTTDSEVGKLLKNNNIYGGGNLACNVFGNSAVTLNTGMLPTEFFAVDNTTDPANPTSMYRKWGEYIGRIEGMTAAKAPNTPEKAIQGSVFGAGYGVHTSVLGNTSVNITIGTSTSINTRDEILAQYNLAKRGGDATGETLASQFVITAFGGGYDGTVGGNTDVQISGSPMLQNVFGGGLGSKSGADASGGYASTVGTVSGSTNVAINGGTVYNNVYGGGAGIFGEQKITIPERGTAKMPYYMASMVHQQTDVTISNGTVVFGNVYGGGDIANTGWYDEASRPTGIHAEYVNASKAKLDLTTALHLEGGNVMGMVFGGGNGRKKAEIDRYNFVGAVIGNTSVVLGKKNGSTWEPGTKVWNNIYGGGQSGSVYSCAVMAGNNSTTGTEARSVAGLGLVDGCTNVEIYNGDVGNNIFGGGWGDNPDGSDANKTSADISGNTYVYFEHGYIITDFYWDQEHNDFLDQYCGDPTTNKYGDTIGKHTRSDLSHNLYGGGNVACVIGTKSGDNLVDRTGNVTVYMIGAPSVDSQNFYTSKYYLTSLDILGSLHFSAFGGGFGMNAKVLGNINNIIALESAGFYSVVGGGMNGPVEGTCRTVLACKYNPAETNPLLNTRLHNVYGGGYYAPVGGAELNIAEAFITDNVFGGGVMGSIDPNNALKETDTDAEKQTKLSKAVTKTTIGLRSTDAFVVKGDDGSDTYTYAYNDHRNRIYIGGNVYGGNDVSGTVNGVAKLNIHGGTIGHNVYGAGNGDHIGYYVPNELLYDLGAHGKDNYFFVDHRTPGTSGNTYVGRPQTIGGVELTLEGNTTDERVTVLGQVFGGGNSCTIGEWDKAMLAPEGKYHGDPHLTRDDPAYFLGGGKIDMNLGSHITIGRTHAQLAAAADGTNYLIDVDGKLENVSGLYMGCSGHHLATQDWAKTNNYYHHYYDTETAKYWPGFAVYKDGSTDELLSRQEGLQSFLAYMNNILVWSDNVNLNIKTDAEDIWLSNFVGGGFRGSMKAKTENGQFHYTLPRGVTIGHDVIGGAFNTDVVYRIFDTTDGHTYKEEGGHYVYRTDDSGLTQYDATTNSEGDYHHIEYAADGTTITGIARFYYDGGMLTSDPDAMANHIGAVQRAYQKAGGTVHTKDFSGYKEDSQVALRKHKNNALVLLTLRNKLETELLDGHVHGGNVFGGCFASGTVEGDIWTDYLCYHIAPSDQEPYFNLSKTNFDTAKDFEDNFAMMLVGAGYGRNTHIRGDVYLRVMHQNRTANPEYVYPHLYNVFGGSFEGQVDGSTNIYFNPGKEGYVAGGLYGGGCNGDVAGKTLVEICGGYADEVYGGARNANVGGGTHLWAYDGGSRPWAEETDAPEAAPLFIGKIFGGTDISGTIGGNILPADDPSRATSQKTGWEAFYSASHWPKELYKNGTDAAGGYLELDSYLQIGGTDMTTTGYPIIGAAYAGGNGEKTPDGQPLPTVRKALIEISDGNIIYAFGGGNKATITEQNYILVHSGLDANHTFADVDEGEYKTIKDIYDVIKQRILSIGVDCYEEKRVDGKKVFDLKNASIQRLFGGNNIATMDIQPKWQLISGRINNVYSGGNMGDMTYYNPAGQASRTQKDGKWVSGIEPYHATNNPTGNLDGSNSNYTPRGLSITIEHPEIHIGSLYGGCRLSDVIPGGYAINSEGNYILDSNGNKTLAMASAFAESDDYYGATVNITDGYIENVYGGNDISGKVHFGTNVNISGAVSGNVYGSGNGFYLYKWDTEDTQITEHLLKEYDSSLSADDKTLCYTVPASAAHNGADANNTDKMLTINDARPSVEKAFLNIAGMEHYPMGDNANPKRVAYVKGNVYCGGNASTILGDQSFSKFKIGSYVTLNGVFMGSDGYEYTQNEEIARFAKVNGFTDMGAATDADAFPYSDDANHYKILLDVYMMAVEMKAQPKDFNLNLPLKEAHIGTFCGGGNRGSMLVDKTVTLPFHHDIIIYDKIVAGCLNANVTYNQNGVEVKSYGGYTRKITDHDTYGNTKIKLDIASQFVPLVMDVPADKLPGTKNEHDETFDEAIVHGFLYDNRTVGVKYDYEEFNDLFQATWPDQKTFEDEAPEEIQWKVADGIYAPSCNIYGGCYQSGEVEGDIELNLYSNMLRYVNENDLKKSIAKNIACFNVYGAGFGQDSHVWGNVHITMDRSLETSTMGTIGASTVSTALETELGESIKWDIQNQAYSTTPTALDCSYPSFNNVFGGGRNGKLIGNTTVEIRNGLVYSDVAGGCYASDMYGSTQVIVGYPKYYKCKTSGEYSLDRADKWNTDKKDGDGHDVIKPSVKYLKGDLVPNNIYESIKEKTPDNERFFTEVTDPTVVPSTANGARGWDDVFIKIGKGVYGGGYSLENSMAASAGNVTTHMLRDDNVDLHPHTFDGRPDYDGTPLTSTAGYGGNSSIMLGDQCHASYTGSERDHIRVSTLNATLAEVPSTSTVVGKFIQEDDGRYTHQGDHTPVDGVTYYTLSGDGGIYGDGHLTFCEGFRAADVTRYGWAEGTPKHPILMNTFQRMDLLSVNDCCIMLQGAQDFATDQIDATIYSITRINEMRLNSTLASDGPLGQISAISGAGEGKEFDDKQQRNYLAFFNNVHYLGSIVTNDAFDSKFHKNDGTILSNDNTTYLSKKLRFITDYTKSAPDANGNKTAEETTKFKQRNVGTARNAIGINNGYCLRIQNQEYEGTGATKISKTYYGPIVGVCEVKLLTLVQGEGGGYVYADNIHEYPDAANGEDHFLMSSGNFVFPGIIEQGSDANGVPIGNQYIVDDCFETHFGTPGNITVRSDDRKPHLDEAHYWYVEGNKYFFNTTLTGFTYKTKLDFDLIKTDPNIVLSGMQNGSQLNIKKIEWLTQHPAKYEGVLQTDDKETDSEGNEIDKISDYEFDIFVGGNDLTDWHNDMPRYSVPTGGGTSFTTGKTIGNGHIPQFNIRLQDKLDNSGDAAYRNHLDEPELVKVYLEGQTPDALGNMQTYEYTITVNIVYLQGPTVTGGVKIKNCALPGELIGFSTEGLEIKTPELMPITAASWQILPLSEIDEHGEWKWDMDKGIVIPASSYEEITDDENHTTISGKIPAYYKQNEYTIAYIFTAGGYDFPVIPAQSILYATAAEYNSAKGTNLTAEEFRNLPNTHKVKSIPAKENRMIVVHNYHRMKDVVAGINKQSGIPDLQIETMPSTIPDHEHDTYHPKFAEAKIYIEDKDDLTAFVDYLNMATAGNAHNIPVGLKDLDIILQKDIQLTSALPDITQKFAGTFHGDGYHIDLGTFGTSLFGDKLAYEIDAESNVIKQGKVYNLGLINGESIASGVQDTQVINCYVYTNNDDFANGKKAYDLSHYFKPDDSYNAEGYVEGRYANSDYQYATTNCVWSLRTGTPNYGNVATYHNQEHTHDAARWNEENQVSVPLYDGTCVIADEIKYDGVNPITYRGLPVGYANDYLFFGQHLERREDDPERNYADDYPVHIEPVANGDENYSKGGNRVYETAGYYHSKEDKKFYYNKDAWALHPSLTAIDYTQMTGEKDNAVTLPAKFSVDSNKDAVSTYNNATDGHVSQNLLVYHGGSEAEKTVFAAGTYAENTAENAIAYHGIIGSGSTYSTDYLHLVDKQCFNAPIEFSVIKKAWYERVPQYFRNVGTNSIDYNNPTAWEGICLPFTATKVSASENGEISHFYGNNVTETIDRKDYDVSELHHEYWLNGMTNYTSGTATFMRPANDGTGLFTVTQQTASDYTYSANSYFTDLSKYNPDSSTRDDVNWYNTAHTFKDYVYLTAGIPYIISFPGNDFYEFSLQGTNYDLSTHSKSGAAQTITFESGATTINMSDDELKLTEAGSAKHYGTYMRTSNVLGMNNTGSKFETGNDALPFRTYMTTSAPSTTRAIWINSIGGDFGIDMEDDDESPEDEMDDDIFKVYGADGNLIVESSREMQVDVFSVTGQFVRRINVEIGRNEYHGFARGVYVVAHQKIIL